MASAWNDDGFSSSGGDDEEEDLNVSEQVAILLIGQSGSGKTYLTKSLVEQFKEAGNPTYVVNDRTRDNTYKKITWDQVANLKDCALIVEDLISARPSMFRILQDALNYQSHHARVNPIIAISHSLTRTNVHGLLPFFHFVYMSAVKMNIASFRLLLRYNCFEPEVRERLMAQFLAENEQFSFFMFDIQKRTVRLTRAEDRVRREDEHSRRMALERRLEGPRRAKEQAYASAKKYIAKMRSNSDYAMLLFDLIYPSLPEGSRFDPADLTTTLLKDGREVVVSIIDYIAALLDEHQTLPDYYLLQFHRYLKKKRNLHLPKTYVMNRNFW